MSNRPPRFATNIPARVVLCAGDRLRQLRVTLEDENGLPVDLSAGTVVFRMTEVFTGAVAVNDRPATIMQSPEDDASRGLVTYIWGDGETDVPGLYLARFVFVVGGLRASFPPDGDFHILVKPSDP